MCVPHTVIMRQEAPWTHLGEDILIKFQPGLVALAVRVLQPEEPDLPQPYRFHHLSNMIFEPFSNLFSVHLIEKLLASGLGLDGELELGVYRRHAHVHRLRHSEATQVLL